LITALLAVDPHHRPTAAQCLQHPWLRADECSAAPLAGAHARLRQAYAESMGKEGFAAAMAAGAGGEEADEEQGGGAVAAAGYVV
jgi:hypothetical protein